MEKYENVKKVSLLFHKKTMRGAWCYDRFSDGLESSSETFSLGAVKLTNNRALSDLSLGYATRVCLVVAEFVRGASLKKRLLVAKNELFIGLALFFDRITDHCGK